MWLILIARLREAPGRAWVCTTPRGFDCFGKVRLEGFTCEI